MEIDSINQELAEKDHRHEDLLPHVGRLETTKFVFKIDFGLAKLPMEPGIILVRGARQYGKSTWLEQQILETIHEFGAGSAYYLNGEYLADVDMLEAAIEALLGIFESTAAVKRIFIDEITAIDRWELALKRLADRGKLADVLVVTTGSRATDLRRGSERLPGRKGRLARTTYLFTPISYKEFHRQCHKTLKGDTLIAYLLSGGSPLACGELATTGSIPELVVELVRDWIEGEIAATGRTRTALFNIMQVIFRFGGTPVGQAKLAREAGLANNTVAAAYVELLSDLGCVLPAYPWDVARRLPILRKPCKYHIINMLAAVVYHPARIRSVSDFSRLTEAEQGVWLEWLVAQELSRRAAIQGGQILEPLYFWQNKKHEIDFVSFEEAFIEVKRGKSSPLAFSWMEKSLPGKQLTLVNAKSFETENIRGLSLEDFLLADC